MDKKKRRKPNEKFLSSLEIPSKREIRPRKRRRSNVMALALRKHLMAVQGWQPISWEQLTRPCAAPRWVRARAPRALRLPATTGNKEPWRLMRWQPWPCVALRDKLSGPSCYFCYSRLRCDVVSMCTADHSHPGRYAVGTPAQLTILAGDTGLGWMPCLRPHVRRWVVCSQAASCRLKEKSRQSLSCTAQFCSPVRYEVVEDIGKPC